MRRIRRTRRVLGVMVLVFMCLLLLAHGRSTQPAYIVSALPDIDSTNLRVASI